MTFDHPILYYVQSLDEYSVIKRVKPFDYKGKHIEWTTPHERWNNSSTLKMNGKSIMEFQFHSKSRNNMAVRWLLSNTLQMFDEQLIKYVMITD